jgi:NAD(P) transhydrogenase subunit beta
VLWRLDASLVVVFFLLALAFGVLMTLPIGGADMPVVISLYNALTGLAVAFEGYVMQIEALIIAGTVVGAAGTFLTQLMAKAMNRPISNVLFSNFGGGGGATEIAGSQKAIEASDAASLLYLADKVIIVPGYGMAVAQAQHAVAELANILGERGIDVKYAIHPVAGRMPGHMNVLLAEANVPYEQLVEMEQINPYFPEADIVLVVGANDVTNPAARTIADSPIYGMPILDVDKASSVIVLKRSMSSGFAGVDNPLFYDPKTAMLFGDAKASVSEVLAEVNQL